MVCVRCMHRQVRTSSSICVISNNNQPLYILLVRLQYAMDHTKYRSTYYLHRRIDALAISGCGWGGCANQSRPSGTYPYSPLLIVIIRHIPILPRCLNCHHHPHPHLENQWCHRRPFQRSAGCQRFDSSHNVEPQTVSDCPCAEPSPVIIWI